MAMVSGSGARWELPSGSEEAGPLDARELELVRQAMTEALGSGSDCEIEQMVRLRSVLPVRRSVQVRLERDLNDEITAVRIVFGRDGDPVVEWTLAPQDEIAGNDDVDTAPGAVEAINAFTAILLHAEAVKRQVGRQAARRAKPANGFEAAGHEVAHDPEHHMLADISASVEHILTNAHRAWRHAGSFRREGVASAS